MTSHTNKFWREATTKWIHCTSPMDNTAGTSASTAQPEVKITPTNRAVLKTLKDLNVKKARAEHHSTLLTGAITDGRTIAGLRREVRPQVPDIPVDFAVEWEEAHITFTDTLTKLLGKYWNVKKDSIDKEIAEAVNKLAIETTPTESAHITAVATTTFNDELTKLDAPKPQRQPKNNIWPRAKRKRGDEGFTQGRNTRQ